MHEFTLTGAKIYRFDDKYVFLGVKFVDTQAPVNIFELYLGIGISG